MRLTKTTLYSLSIPLVFLVGCAQQAPTHRIISELPAEAISIDSHTTPLVAKPAEDLTFMDAEKLIKSAHQIEPVEIKPVWDRIRALYGLSTKNNKRIEKEIKRYALYPDLLLQIQERAAPYMHFIINEIEAKQLPGELALLPIVESAFKPLALSRAKASGLWQFIPSTGKYFGLQQNWWYDGRRDVIASTQAATDYLKQLSEYYNGDWELALASYNAGKGRINRAIRKNKRRGKKTHYWSLKLPRETMHYVPRLLAIAKIFADPLKYNVKLKDIPDQPYFTEVKLKAPLDLAKAAELAETPIEEFMHLNPGFNRWSTSPEGSQRLLIPTAKVDRFKEKLASLPDDQRIKWKRHKIAKGETLSDIARLHKTSVLSIKKVNHLSGNRISTGKHLLIPVSHRPQKHILLTEIESQKLIYTVKKGDSFWRIARKFSVSSRDIARWNNLSLRKYLKPGQKLTIKKPVATTVAARS